MPKVSFKSLITFSLIILSASCSSLKRNDDEKMSESSLYKESTLDVVDRAPRKLSIPTEDPNENSSYHKQERADYHFTLGSTYAAEGNSARAIEEFKSILVYDPKASLVYLKLAAEYVKQGMVNEAVENAKKAIENDPKLSDAHVLLGGLYSALKMYDDALAEYHEVLKINPDSIEAHLFIGALLAEIKKYDEAISYFEKLSKNETNKSPHLAHYYIGRILVEQAGDKPNAKYYKRIEASFKRALSLKPSFVDAYLALGQFYENNMHRSEAMALYKTYEDKNEADYNVAENLARLYMEDENLDKAYQQYEIMDATDANNLNVKVKMAFILIEQKKYNEAILKLEDILGRAPYSDKIRFYLGAVYEETKDYTHAISEFKLIPVTSTYYVESVVHTAYLFKLKNDYPKAIETVEMGIHNKPDQTQFYALYASFLDDLKEYNKAIAMLSEATQKFPEHAQLNFFLGSMHDRVGHTDEVVKSMKHVLEIDANHIQALNYLAYTYADHNINLSDAEKLAKKAMKLQPNDGYIMDTLGWIQFKTGQNQEAMKTLEAAYQMQPTESIIAEHLGDAYYRLQMPEKAKKMYLRASEIEPSEDIIKKLRAKIVAIDQQQDFNVQLNAQHQESKKTRSVKDNNSASTAVHTKLEFEREPASETEESK